MTKDRYALYETAVQRPEPMLVFIERSYGRLRGGQPRVLREDFCGSAWLSTMWVRSDGARRAVAVDRDAQVLEYADRVHRRPLGAAAGRLRLVRSDVRRCRRKADVIASLNFSHFIYKSRADLLAYFRHARKCLNRPGLFICDLYGGPGAMRPGVSRRKFGDFTYHGQQVSYDPETAGVLNHIHFSFPGGRWMRKAFVYDWRLWSLMELREALAEAGFDGSRVFYETERGFDEDFDPCQGDEWVAYLVSSCS